MAFFGGEAYAPLLKIIIKRGTFAASGSVEYTMIIFNLDEYYVFVS
jgi:hypothetical protein